jgi:hypothetical protein
MPTRGEAESCRPSNVMEHWTDKFCHKPPFATAVSRRHLICRSSMPCRLAEDSQQGFDENRHWGNGIAFHKEAALKICFA